MTTDELETATAWFKQYNSRGDNYFDYFNFADTFKGLSQTNVDLIYLRTLQSGKKQVRDSAIRYQIDTELNRFKRKNNINSPFGQQYSNYWDKLSATQMVDILGKRTLQAIENGHESLVKAASNTVKKVCDNFLNSNNAEKEEPTASSQESNRDTTNKNTDVQCSSSSNDESGQSATTLKKLLKDREDIQKFAGSFDLVGQLGIIDLTLPDVAKKVEKLVQTRWAENLKLPSWSPDEPCKRFISQIKASSPNPHLLRLAARDSTTIDPKQFDIYEHNNLRVLEFITEFW
ncbi:hypothetical protein CLU79DRAFT_849613 [Phycomyces nitens]|nr:hypothetical protein CLU79DRAFT_850146 [Phycomyces nitens]KAI9007865.1 hypothetical protein CLU79DRAFT_849613 [Phycomyces nitens]